MRHIRCFLEVAEHGSITKAAASLNTVQPALSRTLRELESELGQTLFERTGQGLILTPAGENFRRHALAGMSQIDRGIQQARGFANAPAVNVGILPNVARTLLPPAVARLKALSPGIDMRLHSTTARQMLQHLRTGKIDFVVGRLMSLEHLTGISFEQLYSEPLLFVARRDHPITRERNLTIDDIDRQLVIIPVADTIIRRELDRFTFARGLVEFSNKIETVSFEFIRSFLASNDAVACIPMGAVRQELASGQLVQLDIHGEELMGSVGLSFVAGRELSPAAAQLADLVRDEARAYA
ncbi:LysR family transcriptional regulator [Breoghania sp. L-A4]|nr:LysR family transcriptional regulator [Breoghania sp. L-A4]